MKPVFNHFKNLNSELLLFMVTLKCIYQNNVDFDFREETGMGDKYLSDAIDYKRDIEPNFFVQIFAGVGSGKNYLIESMIKGELKDCPKQTVLLITSRKAKVQETLTQFKKENEENNDPSYTPIFLDENDTELTNRVGRYGNMNSILSECDEPDDYKDFVRVLRDDWGEHKVYQRSVVCTGAYIDKYLRNVYNPGDITTHLWELFDVIAIDEVHSVVMDATYQDAPFAIKALINEILLRERKIDRNEHPYYCKNLILMTGTPDTIKDFGKKSLLTLDKRNECLSVCPANVSFIQNENVYELIRVKLSKGEKGVYFKNHTPNIQSILKGIKADASEVALSFSKEENRKELAKNDPQSHALMVKTEKMLREECMLPEDIMLFVSTSRNKEGINIKNKDFSYMIVEAHNQSDVVQMAGRVRYGIDELYIVLDAKQFELTSWKLESNFAATEIAFKDTATKEYSGAANDYFKAICRKSGLSVFNNKQAGDNVYTHKELKAYIEYIEKTFDFVRFNFFRNVFELYDLRVSGYKYLDNSKKAFERAAEEDNPYYELVSQWFPSAKVHPLIPKEKQAEQVFEEFIKKYGVTRIPESEVDELRQQLNITLNTKYKSMNSLLKRFTTKKLERMSRGKNKSKYHKYKLEVE